MEALADAELAAAAAAAATAATALGSDGSDGGGPPASLLEAKSTAQAVAPASAVANDACSTTTPALSWTPISWAQFRALKKSEKLGSTGGIKKKKARRGDPRARRARSSDS